MERALERLVRQSLREPHSYDFVQGMHRNRLPLDNVGSKAMHAQTRTKVLGPQVTYPPAGKVYIMDGGHRYEVMGNLIKEQNAKGATIEQWCYYF